MLGEDTESIQRTVTILPPAVAACTTAVVTASAKDASEQEAILASAPLLATVCMEEGLGGRFSETELELSAKPTKGCRAYAHPALFSGALDTIAIAEVRVLGEGSVCSRFSNLEFTLKQTRRQLADQNVQTRQVQLLARGKEVGACVAAHLRERKRCCFHTFIATRHRGASTRA